MQSYIDAGQVNFIYKDFVLPSHRPRAQWAAEAAMCAADQDKYWAYHGQLYNNQKQWTKDELKEYAKILGLDTKKFNTCLDTEQQKATVDAMTNEAQAAKLQGTPTFFVNGKQVDLNQFASNPKAFIEAELKK